MQELLKAEMDSSRESIIPFSVPEVNEETVDMSLPIGVTRQDQEWFLGAEVKRGDEPRLDQLEEVL